MRFKTLTPLLASLSHLVSVTAQTCYYPDRTVAKNDVPCNLASADGGSSACCALNDTCLDNGLCFSQTGLLSRRTCTDQSWQSNECAQYCQTSLTGVGQVLVLAKYAPGASTFCCGPSYNLTSQTCGEAPNTPFTIHLGIVINNRTSGSTSPNTTTSDSQNPPAVVTTTTTATALANSSSNRETAIGVGVGVSLGVALLTALGLLWRERRLRRKVEALHAPSDPSAPAMGSKWHNGDSPNDYRGDVPQLDGSRMEELDGRQVNEMAAREYN